MILRLRSRVGTWRHEASEASKLSEVLANVEHEKSVKITKVSKKPNYSDAITERGLTLAELGLRHGDMLFVDVAANASATSGSAEVVGSGPKRIDAQGNLVSSSATAAAAFRPGLESLRDRKLHWTLTDMVELDSNFTFEIKGEQLSFCSSTSLDANSCNLFQMYLQKQGFQTCRCAYLYGKFVPGNEIVGSEEEKAMSDHEKALAAAKEVHKQRQMKLADLEKLTAEDLKPKQGARVDAIYEPAQENTTTEFTLLEDPLEEKVEALAKAIGLEKVGFLVAHPPGREGYTFTAHEIINSAEQSLEAMEGKLNSPFVIVKVSSDQGNASFDAFSLTPQCLEMAAEDALLDMKQNPGFSAVKETFTLIVEKKEAHVVDNDFFIKRVPILSHSSLFSGQFPRENRPLDVPPSNADLKAAFQRLSASPSDAEIAKALSDFHALVFVAKSFEIDEVNQIAAFVASHVTPGATPVPLQDGHRMLLLSLAGIDV
mmetsp:Transcript_3139/g.5281  ORF Transcript_3139/g.5281 Transcript_3139/m.5281 type:complete len:487 (+) Transcript_3139:157-1617(+)